MDGRLVSDRRAAESAGAVDGGPGLRTVGGEVAPGLAAAFQFALRQEVAGLGGGGQQGE